MSVRPACFLVVAASALGSSLQAADDGACEVRVLATDPETAAQLRDNLERPTFDGVLDDWIESGRVEEVLRSSTTEPGLLNLRAAHEVGEEKVPGRSGTVKLGSELRVSSGSFVEDSRSLAVHFKATSSPAARKIQARTLQASVDLPPATWTSVGQFPGPGGERTTLVIARDDRALPTSSSSARFSLRATVEVFLLDGFTLETLRENLDGREADAAAWLRREAGSMHDFILGFRPGEPSTAEDTVDTYAREGGVSNTGVTLGIKPNGTVLDVESDTAGTPPRSFRFSASFSGSPWTSGEPVLLDGVVPIEPDSPTILIAPQSGDDDTIVLTVSPTVTRFEETAPGAE